MIDLGCFQVHISSQNHDMLDYNKDLSTTARDGGNNEGLCLQIEPSQAARGFHPKTMIYKIGLLCFVSVL